MHEHAFLLHSSGTSWAPVVLLDISLRGISFATPEAVASGTVRQLHFTLPGSPQRHHVFIHIVHQSIDVVVKPGRQQAGLGREIVTYLREKLTGISLLP